MENKTLQIRTDEQLAEEFKELAKDFENQHEAFSYLLTVFRKKNIKNSAIIENKGHIERFEGYLKAINKEFLNILEASTKTAELTKLDSENEINSLKDQLNNKNNEIEALKAQINGFENEKNDLNEQINSQNEQLNSLKGDVEASKVQLDYLNELKAQISELEAISTKDKEYINTLKTKVESLEAENQNQKDVISDNNSNIKVLNSKIQSKNDVNINLNEQIDDYKALIDDLRDSIKDKDNYIQRLNERLTGANNEQ